MPLTASQRQHFRKLAGVRREHLVSDDPPIVAVNANSGNPHYEPRAENPIPIRERDFVLLDVWAKKDTPGAVYYDITWTGFVGKAPSDKMREIFQVVRNGRDAGVKTVVDATAAGQRIAGWQVDRAVRDSIKKAGYGDYFIHRTQTWMTWRFMTSGRSCRTPVSPLNRVSICRNSAFVPKSTCWSGPAVRK
jgi:Xaa-Pro aminopeptidase